MGAATKDGTVACPAAFEKYGGVPVFLYRDILASCGASIGDRLAFRLFENEDGQPQVEAPIWKEVVPQFAEDKKFVDVPFPEYVGALTRIAPSGESGTMESPLAREAFERSVHVPKAFLAELEVGDVFACNLRQNHKGHPQAAEPV